MQKIANVGLIGCGHIAETYFRAHKYFNNFKIIKCADINKKAAENCAKIYKIEAVSVNDILKDKEIEIILNLTIPTAHYLIAKKSFNFTISQVHYRAPRRNRSVSIFVRAPQFHSLYAFHLLAKKTKQN